MNAELLGLLLGCFALGALARRVGAVPRETPRVLNLWVLWVSLPALVLKAVHGVTIDSRVMVASSVLWVCFAICAAAAALAVRLGLATREVAGAVALSAGLGNTAFLGVPLIEALGGPQTVATSALLDQLGSFLVFSFGAVPFAMAIGGDTPSARTVVKRIVTFPPFIALVTALALRSVPFPAAVDGLLSRFAVMLTPLALVSVGWQLDLSGFARQARPVLVGLGWKLLAAPALMLAVLSATSSGERGELEHVAIAQAAMAPMATAAVIAAENKLAAHVSAALAAFGALISFITVPLWWAHV